MHKYHSFMEYVQLYPEYDFIFLGDNGQGDAMCADRVIEKAGELQPCDSAYQSHDSLSNVSGRPLSKAGDFQLCNDVYHSCTYHSASQEVACSKAGELQLCDHTYQSQHLPSYISGGPF